MTLICTALITQRAITSDSDNVSCFVVPESTVENMLQINWIQIIIMLVISYGYRKNSLQRILEKEKSSKQQRQLKNIFDSQPDGVVILS